MKTAAQMLDLNSLKNKVEIPESLANSTHLLHCQQNLQPVELLEDAIAWWMSRWPLQLAKLDNAAKLAAIDGWREILHGMTPAEIDRARVTTETRPFPPDPAAFRAAGERLDGAEQFHRAARAAGCVPPAWYLLSPCAYTCAKQMAIAGWQIRDLDWSRSGVQAAWMEKYRAACRAEDLDPGSLEQPPPAPQKALIAKPDIELARKHISQIRTILAQKTP